MLGEVQHERRNSCDARRAEPESFGFFLCVCLAADGGRLFRSGVIATFSDRFGFFLSVARSNFVGRLVRSRKQGDEAHCFGKLRYDRAE
jgi:hypothetical protein